MDVVLSALATLMSLEAFPFLLGGVLIGIVVSILPGLGGSAGLSLLLPFVFGMDVVPAVAMMIGLLAVTCTGDTFPSVLMGVPGSNSSQATVVDGFPLAKQGKGAMALSAAFSASLIGGIFGAIVLTMGMYAARPLILGTGLGEQLLLILLALSMVGMLTGKSIAKGLAACGLGLLIGTIGAAPATGQLRYTFGTVYLSDGIPLVVLALGVFAVPEIVDLLRSKSAIAKSGKLGGGWLEGVKATLRHPWLVLRCSGLGTLMGALPGLGGSVIDWVAYGHVVQSSKDKSKFGMGDIRGVIAPEAANNAKEGGALFPTLFFGIPGSPSMALLLGGFVLVGVTPGISMVTTNIELTYIIIWSLAIANILATLICIGIAPQVAKLTTINYSYLGPAIVVLIVFTAFQATRSWGDVWAFGAASVLGIYMKRFNWPRAALIIGFVLSAGLEAAVYRTIQVYGFSFLERPQSQVLVALIVISLFFGYRMMRSNKKEAAKETGGYIPRSRLPQISFVLVMVALTAFAFYGAMQTTYLSRLFPVSAAVITALFLGFIVTRQMSADPGSEMLADEEQYARELLEPRPGLLYYLAWFGGLLALVWGLGYPIGSAVFIVVFISFEIRGTFWRNILIGMGVTGILSGLSYWLYLAYPPGLLPRAMSLPWWLG